MRTSATPPRRSPAPALLPSNRKSESTGGRAQPLEDADRRFFESRFQHRFADVRVYADPAADEAARSIDARAFTIGNTITFARGEYRPGTSEGRRLLAHELVHVVQQRNAPGNRPLTVQRKPKQGGTAPPKTLKQAGVDVGDPVFKGTAGIIDAVLARNQTLAPYIGDRLKGGFRIGEKGRFVHELSDGNFENSYKSAYGSAAPSHVMGFYDSSKSIIHLRPGAEFGTALHESLHRLASPALYTTFLPAAAKVSSDLAEVLKEGVTAYFTDLVLKDEGLGRYVDAYAKLRKKAEKLIAALGNDGFDLIAKFNFKGAAIVEIGNALGLSTQQYMALKGGAISEVLRRMSRAL